MAKELKGVEFNQSTTLTLEAGSHKLSYGKAENASTSYVGRRHI